MCRLKIAPGAKMHCPYGAQPDLMINSLTIDFILSPKFKYLLGFMPKMIEMH